MPAPPENPENFDKVNYVIDMWSQPCDAPWYIYIETLKPALLEAFIVLISFGWADVIRGRFRPKGLGRRSSKRKGKWARRLPNFPEIGNTLGKALPFGEQIEDFVKWGTKTRFLWRIDNAMQAGLFFWLVADVVEDFAFNWTSLLYKTYWCETSHLGRFSYTKPAKTQTPGGGWWRVEFKDEDYEEAPPNWLAASGATGALPAIVIAALDFSQHPVGADWTEMQVRVTSDGPGPVFFESGVIKPDATGNASEPLKGFVPPWTRFRVEIKHNGAWAWNGPGVVIGKAVDL